MKKILLSLIVLLSFNGCLNYIQDVQLYADGSGSMRILYWMKLPDNENIKALDRVGIFNADSIRSEFSSPFVNIKNIKVYTDTTDSTTHAEINLTFSHIDSLNQTRAFSNSEFSLQDGASNQKVFTQFIPPVATGFGFDGSDFHVTYKYTFGGEVITNNATAKEGRTLVWNYTLAQIGSGKTISVTFKPFKLKETPYWIFLLSGLVLVIVLIFLLKKKKN